jgi:hypothetical protein
MNKKMQLNTIAESTFDTINEYYNGLNINVRDYNTVINYNTNLNTRQYNIIKSKYKILSQMLLSYMVTTEYIESNNIITNIIEGMQRISDFIDRTDLVISTRDNELKYNINRLVTELRTTRDTNSNNTNQLLNSIGIYNELEF